MWEVLRSRKFARRLDSELRDAVSLKLREDRGNRALVSSSRQANHCLAANVSIGVREPRCERAPDCRRVCVDLSAKVEGRPTSHLRVCVCRECDEGLECKRLATASQAKRNSVAYPRRRMRGQATDRLDFAGMKMAESDKRTLHNASIGIVKQRIEGRLRFSGEWMRLMAAQLADDVRTETAQQRMFRAAPGEAALEHLSASAAVELLNKRPVLLRVGEIASLRTCGSPKQQLIDCDAFNGFHGSAALRPNGPRFSCRPV